MIDEKDFVVMKTETTAERVVELVHNLHCEVYEVVIDGIPVFNCKSYEQANHEFSMECV